MKGVLIIAAVIAAVAVGACREAPVQPMKLGGPAQAVETAR